MRFGLIGCGGIGQLRAEALKKLPEAELTIVCDIDPSLVEEMVRKFGAKKAKDWQALVSEENLDAVIVSTPPHLHAEMCIAALDAGKHVLCEKPLAKNISECQDMVATAKTTGCFLATGFNYRFYPSMIKARQLLDSGIIGPLDHIRSYAGYSAREHGQEWLHDEKIMGGGALRDNGIHLIDLTCYFLNDVTEVKGFSSNSVWQFPGCEDNGFALIRNRRGSVAILQASWNEWRGYRMLVEIYGKLGCIRAYCFPMFVQVIWSKEFAGSTRKKQYFFPKTFIGEHLHSYRWVVVQSFINELQAFMEYIQERPSEVARGEDGLRTMEIAYYSTLNTEGFQLQQF